MRDDAPSTPPSTTRLPISTDEVFDGMEASRIRALEDRHGNGDLAKVLDALGIAGPFRRTSPWELEDPDGRHLIHAGGYAALPFGESDPSLVDTAVRYLRQADVVTFPQQVLSRWRAALETNLVALLASVAPSHSDDRVMFSNSGAEAIEIALKLVRSWRPSSSVLVNFSRAYHGKTLGALSVTPNEEYQKPFRPLLGNVVTLPYGDLAVVEAEVLARGPDTITAIVVEPIQGEGGVITPPDDFLPGLDLIRQRYGIPIVADEIQTGLGRTGHWFASVAGGLDPDVVTLAKPLSGGLVPIGATIARRAMFDAMLPGFTSRRHSSTFAGNGLAMAVGLKALETLVTNRLDVVAREAGHEGLQRLKQMADSAPGLVEDVRGAGMLFALQFKNVLGPGLLGGNRELARLLASGLAVHTLHRSGVHACVSLSANGVARLTPALNMPAPLRDQLWSRIEAMASSYPQAWRMAVAAGPARMTRLAAIATRGAPTST